MAPSASAKPRVPGARMIASGRTPRGRPRVTSYRCSGSQPSTTTRGGAQSLYTAADFPGAKNKTPCEMK